MERERSGRCLEWSPFLRLFAPTGLYGFKPDEETSNATTSTIKNHGVPWGRSNSPQLNFSHCLWAQRSGYRRFGYHNGGGSSMPFIGTTLGHLAIWGCCSVRRGAARSVLARMAPSSLGTARRNSRLPLPAGGMLSVAPRRNKCKLLVRSRALMDRLPLPSTLTVRLLWGRVGRGKKQIRTGFMLSCGGKGAQRCKTLGCFRKRLGPKLCL